MIVTEDEAPVAVIVAVDAAEIVVDWVTVYPPVVVVYTVVVAGTLAVDVTVSFVQVRLDSKPHMIRDILETVFRVRERNCVQKPVAFNAFKAERATLSLHDFRSRLTRVPSLKLIGEPTEIGTQARSVHESRNSRNILFQEINQRETQQ